MLATVPLFFEYRSGGDAAGAPRGSRSDRADVINTLDVLAALLEPVVTHFLWRPKLRDADDEMVLEAAVNGRADVIATFNTRDFGRAAEEFGIGLALPAQLLKRL